MKLEPQASSIIDSIIEFFERLGVCIAVFAGGAGIVHYSNKVLPWCPAIPTILGVVLLFGSIFLSIFVAGSWFSNHTSPIKNKYLLTLIAFIVVATTIFFVIAGCYAAIGALKA